MSKADQLLHKVWDHMHGQNMDGSMRKWGDNDACARNWCMLSDAIGEYFEPGREKVKPQSIHAAR